MSEGYAAEQGLVSERAWLGALVALVGGLIVGSLAFPKLVYERFVWQYFWGPIYSDAHNANCAVQTDGGIVLHGTDAACRAAADTGTVAYTGYTTVSEIGYILLLLFFLIGVLQLVARLGVGTDREFFFALVPFMLFGGALRVIEDATDAVPRGTEPFLTYPWNTLLISPIIYGTVFLIVLGALLASLRLEREDVVDSGHTAMGVIGSAVLAITMLVLFALAFTVEYVDFYPQILVVDLGLATILAYAIYVAADRYKPEINAGTRRIGLVVLWAHAVDGVANVVAADWTGALGHPLTYGAKHPANRFVISVTESVQPADISAAIGTSWPFLFVKLAVALGIVWLFDEQIFEESPRYAILLLVAAVAVGLGPGTRDMLRVTFAI